MCWVRLEWKLQKNVYNLSYTTSASRKYSVWSFLCNNALLTLSRQNKMHLDSVWIQQPLKCSGIYLNFDRFFNTYWHHGLSPWNPNGERLATFEVKIKPLYVTWWLWNLEWWKFENICYLYRRNNLLLLKASHFYFVLLYST